MRYKAYIASHGGKVRKNNEDNGYVHGYYRKNDKEFAWCYETEAADNMLLSVFDGMGGEENGEVASRVAAQTMKLMNEQPFSQVINEYVDNAGRQIQTFAGKANTGTTYVAVSIEDNVYHFSNLGDSRGYLFREGKLTRLTKDHNMVEELFQMGVLTEEQAKKHPDRHTLYQYLGMKEDEDGTIMEAHIAETLQAESGDICLLCSDGLIEMVSEKTIVDILTTPTKLSEKAERLKETALMNGGKDNVTVLLVESE